MISVFKTSVKKKKDIAILKPYLNEVIGISNWGFDLEDCDNILRVESSTTNELAIAKILEGLGYECEELTD